MKKQTLWKRIFGQKSDKKAKAQQAFQEQFDTKLRFRELEPRVVLDATVNYNMGTDTLQITYTDAGEVTLGRDGSGKLVVGGTNLTFTGDAFNGLYDDIASISVIDSTSKASEFTLLGGANALTGLVSNLFTFQNVDLVNVDDGADFSVSGWFQHSSNSSDTDNNVINFDGKLAVTNLNFIVNADSSKTTTVTDSATSKLVVSTLYAQEVVGATGKLSLDLTKGDHDFASLTAGLQEVEIALVDSANNLFLYDVNATELSLESTGSINSNSAYEINVSGIASFTGASIDLDDSSVGHNFNKLTLNSTGSASIVETDGFNFHGGSEVDGTLTIVTNGSIGQTGGSYLWTAGTANFTVGDNQDVILDTSSNRFEGTTSVTAKTTRADAVNLTDGNGNLTLGNIKATTVDLQTFGGMFQTGNLDVSSTALFKAGTSDNINLSTGANLFGGTVSAQGQAGALSTLKISDSLGDLTLDVIKTGSLEATAVNGGITQTATGLEVTGTSTFTVANGQNIDLDNSASNKFNTVSAKGAAGAAGNVFIDDSDGGLVLGEINATNLDATAVTFLDQTAQGVKVASIATFTSGDGQAIDFNNASNNQFGTVHAAGLTGAAGSVFIEDSAGDLTLGAIDAANLNAKAAAQILQTSDGVKVSSVTTITSGDGAAIELDDSTMNEFGTVTAKGATGAAGTVSIADSDNGIILDVINASALNVSAVTTIGQTVSGVVVSGTATFKAGDGENIDLDNSIINQFGVFSAVGQTGAAGDVFLQELGETKLGAVNAENLSVTASTNILQTTDGVKVSDTASFVVGNGFGVNMQSSTANEFATVSAKASSGTAGIFALDDTTGNLELDDVQVGSLVVSTVGEITQTTTGVKVVGTSSFTSGDGQDILLSTSVVNSFGDAVSASGATGAAGHVSIRAQTGDLKLGAIDAGSATLVSQVGKIWQTSDGVQVSGDAQFTSGSGQDILLNSSSNNILGGEVDLVATSGTPANVALNNSGTNLLLDQVEASGNLTIVTNGGITQTNAGVNDYVQVGGTSSFTVSDGANVELGVNTNNKFNTVNAEGQTGAAGDVLLYDSDGDLTLGDIVAQNLTAENGAGADILDTMTTAIEVSGLTTLTGNNILLNTSTAKHQINQLTLAANGNANVVELNGFSFVGTNTVGGNLTVNAGGAIDQPSGSLTVMGTTDITSTGSITLNQSGNDFQDSIALSGTDITILEDNEIKLGNITADSLDVQALAGKIYQEAGAALDIAGTTLAKATDTYDVILDQAGNDFTGAVSVLGFSMPANVVLTDMNDLVIGDIDSETLVATAGASITQAAGTSIDSDTSVSLDAGTTITLRDLATITLDLKAGNEISQESGTALIVSGMTTIEVGTGENVDLSEAGNEFDSIGVIGTGPTAAGDVTIVDADGGLTLKDIIAENLTVTVNDTADVVSVDQMVGTAVNVSGMTTIVNNTGGEIQLSNSDNLFNQIGATSVDGATRGVITIVDADGGVELKDVVALNLLVTTNDTMDVVGVTQVAATSIDVSGTTSIFNNTGGNVDLSNAGNLFDRIVVSAVDGGTRGDVTIRDDDGGLVLDDITAANLDVTVNDTVDVVDVSQFLSGTIDVTSMTTVTNNTGGNITLANTGNQINQFGATTVDGATRGNVSVQDDDGGIVLKDIVAAKLDVTVNDTMDIVDVTQVAATSVDVSGMTTIVNNTGGAVTLGNSGNLFGQIGVTSVDGGTRGAVLINDVDGGIELNDIVAGSLAVTVSDTMDIVEVTQVAAKSIDVTGITSIDNSTGGNVDLSNMGNLFNQIGVSSIDGATRGDVTIRDDDGGVVLLATIAANLDVTVNDTMDVVDVTQAALTTIDITLMTTVTNSTGGNILLSNADNKLGQFGATTVNGGTRGDVAVSDSEGGIELKDIVAANLTVTVDDSVNVVDVTQVAGATIDVTMMTMITNNTGGNVDLSNADNKIFQIGVITEDGATRGDVTIVDDYDGLELKDIVAKNLTVTIDDVDDDMAVDLTQVGGAKINVTEMTMITNETGGAVDLSNAGNEITQIMVTSQDAMTMLQGDIDINDDFNDLLIKDIIGKNLDAVAVGAISQLDGTAIVTTQSASLTSEMSTVTTGDITTPVLSLTADDDITQSVGTTLTVSMQTNLALTSKATIELLNVGNDLSKNVDLDLDGDDERIWDFEIRNENVDVNMVPTGDFEDVAKKGSVDDLTLEFVNAAKLELPEISITDDLRIVIAGDLTQAGDILVGDTALFDAGSIVLADDVSGTDLIVYGNATFTADSGDIEVGVKSGVDIDSLDRGEDAGTDVAFGSLNFSAAGHHVTISEQEYDQPPFGMVAKGMDLVGDNTAKSAVLRSATDINDSAGSSLTVTDLTSFYAENIVLGDSVDRSVDLRIVYLQSTADVSLFEKSDTNSLAIVDGSKIAGTLAIQTDGHIVQVNEFRTEAPDVNLEPEYNHIFADKALLVSNDGGVLLTSASFKTLAASAGNTSLFVDAGSKLDLDAAGIASGTGFIDMGTMVEGVLATDAIDADLPDDNTDPFAVAARADSFLVGDGENYSIVVVDANDTSAGMDANGLVIGKVEDTTGGNVLSVNGIRTNGDDAGHVFVRTLGDGGMDGKNDGSLTIGTTDAGLVVGLANSGVITALARGNLTIATGSWLHVTDGADPDVSPFALVSTVEDFVDNPASDFEIDNTDNPPPNDGPSYSRIPGNVDTYVLGTQTGKDSTATIVLDKLGTPGMPDEMDFEVTLDFADTTELQEEFYPQLIDADTAILHDIPWEFATTTASTVVTLQAYNSPQINLFGNVVDAGNFNNLNVVVDQFEIFFLTPIDYVPEMTNFVAPNNPYIAPIIPPEANPTPYAALTEIADDTRVATQIDGVTVVEVDPSDFMEKGEKIELDDDFMTLDAVKEYIQNGVQFPVGLYKIEILYPGSKEPEVYFYWKQDRLDPFDLFSNNTKPVAPQAVELAAADQAKAQLSAEEVWAREYDKWFPGVSDLQPADDLSVPAAEGEPGDMMPREDDILLERVTTVSLQEIDRMTDRLRAKRSIVRDSLSGAMIGGAALMAAVAAQGRKDDEAPNHHPEEQGPQPGESLDETSLGRLRRRVRQWL